MSYTDSGPPFQFEWGQLRAQVQSSRDASDIVGDGWLLVRVRGRCNFEHQGVSDGAICGVIKTTPRADAEKSSMTLRLLRENSQMPFAQHQSHIGYCLRCVKESTIRFAESV